MLLNNIQIFSKLYLFLFFFIIFFVCFTKKIITLRIEFTS
jgi:hypothetical protein